jgi:hypothetical protein
MRNDRRIFLAGWLAVAGSPLWASAQQHSSSPLGQGQQPGPPLPATTSPSLPSPDDFPPITTGPGPANSPAARALLEQDRKDLQHDAASLALMASDLKKQIDELDTTKVLSLDLIHQAEAIEKLAHQIKTLAQGR